MGGGRPQTILIVAFLSLLMLGLDGPRAASGDSSLIIIDFYSCDRFGDPQSYFPKGSAAYFNITVGNPQSAEQNTTIYLLVQDELLVPVVFEQLATTMAPNASTAFMMPTSIPHQACVGVATAYASVHAEGLPVDSATTSLYIGAEDQSPPVLDLLSPQNTTYQSDSIPLEFTANERTSWIGYSLNSLQNVTIFGNSTIEDLPNDSYRIVVYANDTSDNMASSGITYFTKLAIHDIAVTDITSSHHEAYSGQSITITVTVKNEGTIPESFDVTTYCNCTPMDTSNVDSLLPNGETSINIVWDTAASAPAKYAITAEATPLPTEADTEDNTCHGGIITVLPPPDVEVLEVVASKGIVCQGFPLVLNVTVRNLGTLVSFCLTINADTTAIHTENITLADGEPAILTFTWNVAKDFPRGNYTLSAKAEVAFGEVDTADNEALGGSVTVTIPGDINADAIVDILDCATAAVSFNSRPKEHNWNPNADISGDGIVDIFDVAVIALHFGDAGS